MSLRTRLIISHSVAALLAIALVAIVTSIAINRYFQVLAQTQARQEIAPLIPVLEQCYRRNNQWPNPASACFPAELFRVSGSYNKLQALVFSRRILLVDTRGVVLFDSGNSSREGTFMPEDAKRAAIPLVLNGQQIGAISSKPNQGILGEAEDRFVVLVQRSMIIASIGGSILALLSGLFLAIGLTKPLRNLTQTAHQIAQGERTVRVADANANDEVGELSRAFNRMSEALERAESHRRQMVADIAHELRTPLSVLQLELESIEDGIIEITPRVISSLNEEVSLLNRLIGDLRTLSLADAGQLNLQLEPIDVHSFMQRLLPRYQAAARDKQINLHMNLDQHLGIISADSDRLAQVLHNLIHNAIRYTPESGHVFINVTTDKKTITWQIQDNGPGFNPAEADALFERFYRTDKARVRETGGSGLGLPIARGITEAMGGRIWAESNNGALFSVQIPLK